MFDYYLIVGLYLLPAASDQIIFDMAFVHWMCWFTYGLTNCASRCALLRYLPLIGNPVLEYQGSALPLALFVSTKSNCLHEPLPRASCNR